MQHKAIQLLVTAAIAALIAGCVPSWNALFTERDLIVDAKLVGTFNGDDGEVWEFAKDGDKKYKLTYTDKDGKATFEAHLLKIQDRQFLDVQLDEKGYKNLKIDALTKITMVPAHIFFRVDEVGDSVKLAAPNPDWLSKHLEKNPKAIGHLKKERGILLFTAETKDLQAFVMKHAVGEALFGDPFTLKRRNVHGKAPAARVVADENTPVLCCWFVEDDGSGRSGYAAVDGRLGSQPPEGGGLFRTIAALREALRRQRISAARIEPSFDGVVPKNWKIRKLTDAEVRALTL